MSLQISKAKSATGIALVSAILAGCGGGGGSSAPVVGAPPAGGFTTGSAACPANASPETIISSKGALLGSCEEYTASVAPTRASTAFKSPGTDFSLTFANNIYKIATPTLDVGGEVSISASSILSSNGGLLTASLGDLSGSTVQFVPPNDTVGAASTIYDFVVTKDKSGQNLMNLKYSRYGVFSRFKSRVEGYYGGWALGNASATPSPFPTGTTSFTGYITGVIARDAAATGAGAAAGFSAVATIVVDSANTANPVKSISLTSIVYSSSTVLAIARVGEVTAVVPTVSTLTSSATSSAITAEFVNAPATGVGLSKAILAGSFYGPGGPAVASEIVGTLKFTTPDGRNGIGAFGVKTGVAFQL
jgi:hypothetical protein